MCTSDLEFNCYLTRGRWRRLVLVLLARSAPRRLSLLFFGRAYCPIYIRCAIVLVGICMAHVSLCSYYIRLCWATLLAFPFSEWLLVKRLQGLFSPHFNDQEPYELEPKALPTVFGHHVLSLSCGFKTSHNTIHKAEILQYSA